MAGLTWTDFNNGDTLAFIRNDINSFNTSVEAAVNENTADIGNSNTDIIDLQAEILEFDRQMNMDTSKLGVNIDTILTTGCYEVNTGLPYGLSAGELRVGYDVSNPTRVIQQYVDLHEAVGYRRQWNGVAFTSWQELPQSLFNDDVQVFATNLAQTKADIEYVNKAIINTYTGNTPPTNDLGKNGDKYHQYATEAPITDMLVGTSAAAYTPTGVFGLFFDPVATGAQYLAINAEAREVYFEYGLEGFPTVNDIILEISGNDIVTTIKSQTSVGVTLTYLNTFDAIVAGIIIGTSFKVKSKGLSGAETDYTKAQNIWFITPIYSNTYDYGSSKAVVITTTTFTDIINNTTLARDAGIYQITFNVNAQYNSTTDSMQFRYSLDGGQQWSPIIWKKPQDLSDAFVLTDTFVHQHAGGSFGLIIQGACQSAGRVLTANFANVIADRKI